MAKKRPINIEVKETDLCTGLTQEEVDIRTKAGLDNPIKKGSSRSIIGIIFTELLTYFNLIYFVITCILLALGQVTQLTFLVVILSNLFIGIIQKIKSKLTIDKLSLLIKSTVIVIRDGERKEIDTDSLVRDDIMEVSLGKQIGADSVVVDGVCNVNEALLTGESLPVKKQIGDHLLAGSYVVGGSVLARVEKVGDENYIQKLTSEAKKYRKPKSEILNSLNSIIKVIGIAIIPLAFLLYISSSGFAYNVDNVLKTSGAILGMIPSGMFLLTSTTLAVSVIRLSEHNILVQELYCIEMLARVNMVCMDKTGTITDGSMNVTEVTPISKRLARPMEDIIGNMLISVTEDNPTMLALKAHFRRNRELKAVNFIPFSSETKYFAVDYGKDGVYYLGAPEYLTDKEDLLKTVEKYASLGNRVLLLAHSKNYEGAKIRQKSEPLGLVVLEDNIRKDAIDTIAYFKENGVNLKVISGDNPLTVAEVARKAGVAGADKYISLQDMSDEEIFNIANDYNVFGRVSPQQKEILIKAFKSGGNTVAMIGDGVNDILALREADCSIAIGAGSESARNVSHLILLDSKFSSMQHVVSEGRRSTNNLQNTSVMFLTKTVICITLCLFCILFRLQYPFSPNQLMILELFAIGIPSFFFALQPNKNLIKGKFLESILLKSFNYGLSALIFIMPLYLFASKSFSVKEIETMIILIVTFNSIFVMLKLAIPFNKYRFAVFTSMTICAILSFIFLSNVIGTSLFLGTPLFNFLNLETLTSTHLFICLALIALLPFTQMLFMTISKKIISLVKHTHAHTNRRTNI